MTSRPIGRSLSAPAPVPLHSAPLAGGGHGGHHGGGRRGGFGPWWGGGPWYGDYGPEVYIVGDTGCPSTFAPVIGADGVVYQNACVAQQRGVKAMKAIAMSKPLMGMDGFSVSVNDQDVTPGFWLGVAAGVLGTSLLRSIFR